MEKQELESKLQSSNISWFCSPGSPSILIKTSSGDIKAQEGDLVNLLCSAQGEPSAGGKPETTGKFYGKGQAPSQFFTCNSERSNKFRKIYSICHIRDRFGSTTRTIWVQKLKDAGQQLRNAISNIWDTMNMLDDPNDKLFIWEKLFTPGNIATNRDNYRPISILPCLSKICESCVNNQMNEHDQEFQTFFEPSQYAYKKHSSTLTALIQVIDSLQKLTVCGMDQKQYSLFIDLRKAFDIIDHRVLLERLSKYGFGETEANWICSYLTDRQQYVVCNGVQSQQLPIN
ncbi:Hypothetical predicted protein [Paramuricea clavata]|uniref:Reverse transcriptase domain-containing protein n=1 Tax=Paramuricea clavata TaxID=317549 RepID=A0A6S7HYM8_PARCT|nr:Hypothetical predicted protein [Paramuricea clavata]